MTTAVIRVLLVADTHGSLDPRIAELAEDCALAVHAGDVGGSGVLEALAAIAGRVWAVAGNNDVADKWSGAAADLAALPAECQIALPGGVLAVEHGHRYPARRRHQRLRDRHPNARALLYGHSHRLQQDLDSPPWLLNPGAAGRVRTHGGPSCLVLTAALTGWRVEAFRYPLRRKTR